MVEFSDDAKAGALLAELWPAETVLELELTPNRTDAFSLLGVARDLAAKLDVAIKHPAQGVDPGVACEEATEALSIDVEDAVECPRFTARIIDHVRIKPSPLWIQRRLAALGLTPRNNIVDATNLVTFELGQPSHAYDRERIGAKLSVRRAHAEEKFAAIGGQELQLAPEDLVVAARDDSGADTPVALAGVIGGAESSVSPSTQQLVLEVAHFDPVTIRKAAKRHKLITDAHYRFERGTDPNLPPIASARLAHLIEQVSGGKARSEYYDVGVARQRSEIRFRPERVPFLTALAVESDVQKKYLERLGCVVRTTSDGHWSVRPPSWRFDLALEEDLVEEVARLYGYENIPETFPTIPFVPDLADVTYGNLRMRLASMGFQEIMNYVFVSAHELEQAGAQPHKVVLESPLSAERNVLRTSLRPGLLAAARTNREWPAVAFFEIGRVFTEQETERLGLLLRGEWGTQGAFEGRRSDFFVLKGILEQLADLAKVALVIQPEVIPGLHPGVAGAVIWNGERVGIAGRVHPEIEKAYGISETFMAELDLPLLGRPETFAEYSRQPSAERDLSILAAGAEPYDRLEAVIRKAAGPYLLDVAPFDVYQGKGIPTQYKSVGIRMRFRHPTRALRDEEVDRSLADVIAALQEAGYAIRT
ncbi:phenylalanine--tRNA ligase subunit beta [Alkalilimnicola ehrlichii]|uniref:Phenylalanine--tRNA ligase beta subunit n=1 Tax=Alkalilimnicola ehrlichii TaxID=351052 RepID=A0A3E0WIA0_9GAMM|nr:phenylalanine--tRNA ligase subunit beta [Alkalilimnicola ehrlichii]RFA32710.1 phenylalanine--tRNA ligase subunit beta [Alkalilimnicola ehrlichii]